MAYSYTKNKVPRIPAAEDALLQTGTDFEPVNSYQAKMDVLKGLTEEAKAESQQATNDAGFAGSMGKMVDAINSNKTAMGPGFKSVKLGSNSNAEGILSSFQNARAKGSEDKLKILLEQYKLGNQEGMVKQGFTGERTDALKGLLNAEAGFANGGAGGFRIPASTTVSITDVNAANGMLDNLQKTIEDNEKKFGPVKGRLGKINEYDEQAQSVQAVVNSTKQIVGKYLEGGILRAEDEIKYERILPKLSDKPAVAKAKLETVRELVRQKNKADMAGLKGQGYVTQGLHLPTAKKKEGDINNADDIKKSILEGL